MNAFSMGCEENAYAVRWTGDRLVLFRSVCSYGRSMADKANFSLAALSVFNKRHQFLCGVSLTVTIGYCLETTNARIFFWLGQQRS
jgi:hypothetical protein